MTKSWVAGGEFVRIGRGGEWITGAPISTNILWWVLKLNSRETLAWFDMVEAVSVKDKICGRVSQSY